MNLRWIVAVMLFIVMSPLQAEQPGQQQMEALISGVLDNLANEDYYALAEQFHYPPSYTKRALDKDKCAIRSNVQVMVDEFGELQSAKPLEMGNDYYSYDVVSGDREYWARHKAYIDVPIDASFSKSGEGVIKLQFVEVAGRVALRSLGYGKKVEAPEAKPFMDKLKSLVGKSRTERIEKKLCGE